MKKSMYLLSGVISLSNIALLLTIHNIGVSSNYTFAKRDPAYFFVPVFVLIILFCIYKYVKSDE